MKSSNHIPVLAVVVAACLGGGAAQAASVTLPLGPIHTGDFIENYYNGGTDSTGEGPGQNLGIGFSSNAVAQKAGTNAATGAGRFENNPSGQSEVLAYAFSNSTASYINYAGGFSALSFNYSFSNNTNAGSTENAYVYSGLNGTGTLLDTLTLTPTAAGAGGCSSPGDAYCVWSLASTGTASLGAAAESVLFGTTPGSTSTSGAPVTITEFDGVTFTPAAPVPLPAAVWLLASGLGGLLRYGRRRTPSAA